LGSYSGVEKIPGLSCPSRLKPVQSHFLHSYLILLDLTSILKHTLQEGSEIMTLPTKNPDHKVTKPELLYVQFITARFSQSYDHHRVKNASTKTKNIREALSLFPLITVRRVT